MVLLDTILDLLSPPRCGICDRPLRVGEVGICGICGESWVPRTLPCDAAIASRTAFCRYAGGPRRALLALKFSGESWRARQLGQAGREHATARVLATGVEAVVPIPLGRARLRERGYNQAERLARALVPSGARPQLQLLARVRETPPQSSLSGAERGSIRGAFRCLGASPSRVLLVDDVTTTGETLAAAAEALRGAGATEVHAIAVAFSDDEVA